MVILLEEENEILRKKTEVLDTMNSIMEEKEQKFKSEINNWERKY